MGTQREPTLYHVRRTSPKTATSLSSRTGHTHLARPQNRTNNPANNNIAYIFGY